MSHLDSPAATTIMREAIETAIKSLDEMITQMQANQELIKSWIKHDE